MNKCFFIGKVIEDVKYDFMINGNNDAISKLKVKLMDGEIVNVILYNENADYCYRVLDVNDAVFIYARLESLKENPKLSNYNELVCGKDFKEQLSVIAEEICKLS